MTERRAIQTIRLKDIDLADETFSVNFGADLRRLRSSIEEIGLIEPVLLREKPEGYQIVCGFRRVSVLRELGNVGAESRVFGEKEVDPLKLFTISIHENLTTRGFNSVEKAIALDKLVHHFQMDRRSVIKTFLPLLSLETNEKILNTFLVLARMEDEFKRYVLEEEVSRSNIRLFSTLKPEDRRAILSLLPSLKLSENRLREVLTFLHEISQRDRLDVEVIVDRPEIRAVLSEKELTPSQKTERLRKILWGLRYPRMHLAEEAFEKKRRVLSLPPGMSLHHPPFFEGEKLRAEFQFETLEEFRSAISSLSDLGEKKEFLEMIEGQAEGIGHRAESRGRRV
jgi:ParB family transcriptional regulator, chromosome partitioning protein